jgi:hypothetical protein
VPSELDHPLEAPVEVVLDVVQQQVGHGVVLVQAENLTPVDRERQGAGDEFFRNDAVALRLA